jgi:hypothetical protein
VGAGTAEGSGVQGEEDGGIRYTTKENKDVHIGRGHEGATSLLETIDVLYHKFARLLTSLVLLHRTVSPDPLQKKRKLKTPCTGGYLSCRRVHRHLVITHYPRSQYQSRPHSFKKGHAV